MATHDGVDVIEVAETTFTKTRNMRITDEDSRDQDDESDSEGKRHFPPLHWLLVTQSWQGVETSYWQQEVMTQPHTPLNFVTFPQKMEIRYSSVYYGY